MPAITKLNQDTKFGHLHMHQEHWLDAEKLVQRTGVTRVRKNEVSRTPRRHQMLERV